MGQQELRRDDDVVEDGEVTAEAVAGAELRQRQVHLVHAATQRRERERRTWTDREEERRTLGVFRKHETNVLTVTSVRFGPFLGFADK